MLKAILAILLFLSQLYLTFKGVNTFGIYINPILLLISNIILFYFFIKSCTGRAEQVAFDPKKKFNIPTFVAGLIIALLCIPSFNSLIKSVPEPVNVSDVIPQLTTQYERFVNGEMPYQVVPLHNSTPFPVYMPLHWLPVSLSELLNIDVRWSGFILLSIAFAFYTWAALKSKTPTLYNIVIIMLPLATLQAFIYWGSYDLPVTLETIIAAYYLILAIGLLSRNFTLIILGTTLCLLSRYTLIFWLPLFTILLFLNKGLTQTLILVSISILSILVFFVLPFLMKEPAIFLEGLKYHNAAAEYEWAYGSTYKDGLYFIKWLDNIIKGSVQYKVLVTRVLQASLMLLTMIVGLWYYFKNRKRLDFYPYSLGMLYITLVLFFAFSPLTYRYYHIVTLMVASILSANIISTSTSAEK